MYVMSPDKSSAEHLAIDLWSLAGTVWELRVTFAVYLYVNQDFSHSFYYFHSLLRSVEL